MQLKICYQNTCTCMIIDTLQNNSKIFRVCMIFFFLNLDRLEFAMHNYDFLYHTCKCNLSLMKHI